MVDQAGASETEDVIRTAFDAEQLDVAATRALEAYGPEILSFLAARLNSPGDAREVFSIFAEDLWTGLPGFGWRCSVRTWLYTLARNAAARFATAPQRRVARNLPVSGLEDVSALVDRIRSATHVYQQTEVKDRFRQLREQLSDEDRMLLVLRVDRGMAWRDLALAMRGDVDLDDASIDKEAARLRKAFERMKRELRRLAEREGLLEAQD